MRTLIGALVLTATALVAVGCSSSGGEEGTAQDKANIERLHKEGIGKVMAEDAAKKGKKGPVSLANPDGGPGADTFKP